MKNYIELIDSEKSKTEDALNETVNIIRKYAKSQKRLWQKIPYLALQADNKKGRQRRHLQIAYMLGYYEISGNIFIDCENGKLLSYCSNYNDLNTQASLADNTDLFEVDIESLNAQKIIEKLTEQQKMKDDDTDNFRICGKYTKPKEWRKYMRKKYKLHKDSYKRKSGSIIPILKELGISFVE